MRGLAAELRGARDWMKVATAWLVGESGISPYTCTIKNKTSCKKRDSGLRSELHAFSNVYIYTQELNTETTRRTM